MQNVKHDIQDRQDIELLVNSFYGKVREDELLGPIFDEVIQDHWPEHLEKMYRFWETILLWEKSYRGNPFMPHAKLMIDKQHFDLWLGYFHATLDEFFHGEIADEAKWRSNKMAQMFQLKLEQIANSPQGLWS